MNKLLLCPFCESELTILPALGEIVEERVRHEENTGCPLCSKVVSLTWWNTRTPDPRLKEAIEEIEKMRLSYKDNYDSEDSQPRILALRYAVEIIKKHIPEVKE